MIMTATFDIAELKEKAETPIGDFPVFDSGLYQCTIIGMEERPDNTYQGEPKPCVVFKLRPEKDAVNGEMKGTDGKKIENFYTKDNVDIDKFFFLNVTLPVSMDERAWFRKLVDAIFKGTVPSYTTLEEFVGNTILAQVEVNEKNGKKTNKIIALSNDKDNDPEDASRKTKIRGNDLDKALEDAKKKLETEPPA